MDIFNTAVLNRVIDALPNPSSFLLDVGFRQEQTETSEEIHFDVESNKPRITPFVHPTRAGKVIQDQGFRTDSFRPAYAKDKREFDPGKPLKRAIGEQIGGNLSPEQRMQIAIRRSLADQLSMLGRREAVMAAQALTLGKVTVSGDGYPTKVVDFDRHPSLTIALAGGSQWGDAGVSIVGSLEDWAGDIQAQSGALGTTVIMDPRAWRLAHTDDAFMKLFESRRGSESTAETGPISRGYAGARNVGFVGDFDIWVYQDTYVDENDVTQQMIPDNTVVMLDPINLEGTRCYGAIRDPKAGYQARRFFSKSWDDEDPAVRWLLLQSAPLVVPYRVNASFAATVA